MNEPKSLQQHQRFNRDAWTKQAKDYVEDAEDKWRTQNPVWGIWQWPNSKVPLLPASLAGKTCLEIGCGTAYVSSWMATRGGECFAIDPTPRQLATANRLRADSVNAVHLVESFGETLPFPDDTFDFAISEYGASLWADPYQWIPEVARVLRLTGQLVFMTCHVISQLCCPDDDSSRNETRLLRPYLDLYRLPWTDPPTVEFQLPHGKWIELLSENGFVVERLLEIGAPKNGVSRYEWADAKWAQSWPTEEVWFAKKT